MGSLETSEPTSVTSLAILALAYEAIRDPERASELAEEVLQLEPNHRAAHALLGRLHHEAGRIDDSRRHLRSYLALAPEGATTQWARDLISD